MMADKCSHKFTRVRFDSPWVTECTQCNAIQINKGRSMKAKWIPSAPVSQ